MIDGTFCCHQRDGLLIQALLFASISLVLGRRQRTISSFERTVDGGRCVVAGQRHTSRHPNHPNPVDWPGRLECTCICRHCMPRWSPRPRHAMKSAWPRQRQAMSGPSIKAFRFASSVSPARYLDSLQMSRSPCSIYRCWEGGEGGNGVVADVAGSIQGRWSSGFSVS